MNIIENVWGYMVHKIYKGSKKLRQCCTAEEGDCSGVAESGPEFIDNLYLYLDSRIFELTTNQGGTSY
uniref:Uncharacterized protein n=1 Tax=Caenorhabditis japonica TaxID=281687 RepID=A0A8R1IKA1_CAEJA